MAAETEDTLIYDNDLSDTAYDSETGYDDPMEDAYDVFTDDSLYDEDPVGDDLSSGDADAYSSYDDPVIDEQNIVEDADIDADEILSEDDGSDAAADSDSELYVEDDDEALSETDASDEALSAGGMTLDANGGVFPDGKSTYSLSYTTVYLSSHKPEKSGYVFNGWYAEAACNTLLSKGESGSNLYTLKDEPAEGTTIYAGWAECWTLTYVFGNETGSGVNDTGYYWDYSSESRVKSVSYKIKRGNKISSNEYPSSTSYIRNTDLRYSYSAWYEDEARSKKINSITSITPASDRTFYAGYKEDKHVVTIHSVSSTGYFTRQVIDYNEADGQYGTAVIRANNSGTTSVSSIDNYAKNSDPRMAYAGIYFNENCTDDQAVTGYSADLSAKTDLWIKWEASNAVITFDPNGGYFSDYNNGYTPDTESRRIGVEKNKDVSKTVYHPRNEDLHKKFLGWSADGTEANIVYPSGISDSNISDTSEYYSFNVSEDVTYKAVWKDAYYVATFNAGSGTMDYYDYSTGENVEKTGSLVKYHTYESGKLYHYPYNEPVPTDPSKAFAGWYAGDTKVDSLYSYVISKDTTFTAHYATAYTVTCDANGGYFQSSGVQNPTAEYKVASGEGIYLSDPKCDNKEFGGWYTDQACTKPVVMESSRYYPTGSITLYAKWLNKFTVTFKPGADSPDSDFSIEVTEGQLFGNAANIPADPRPTLTDSMAFEGWYTDEDCTDPISKSEILATVINSNKIFYAKFTAAYTVTFNRNGGQFASSSITGDTYSVKVAQGKTLSGKYPNMKSTEDQVFRGWFTKANPGDEDEVINLHEYVVDEDITFYAAYTECYTLTFHPNAEGATLDGSADDVKVKVVKGTAYRYGKEGASKDELFVAPKLDYSAVTGRLPFPRYDGSDAYAWTENPDGTGRSYYFDKYNHCYEEDGTTYYFNMYGFVPTKDMDFYVKWGDIVTVTYDPNGGTFLNNSSENKYTTLTEANTRLLQVPTGITYNKIHTPSTSSTYITPPAGSDKKNCSWGYLTKGSDYTAKDYIGSTPITRDTTIYANWRKSGGGGGGGDTPVSKTLTLHACEGYFGSVSTKTKTISYTTLNKTTKHNTDYPETDDPSKAFSGWYYDEARTKAYPSDLQLYSYSSDDWYILIPKDVTDLYAGYGPAYTVTYNANGGYFDTDADRVKEPTEQMKDDTLIMCKQSLAGYGVRISEVTKRIRRDGSRIFGGWFEDAAFTKPAGVFSESSYYEFYTPKTDTTLYAKWIDYELPEAITASPTAATLTIGGRKQLTAAITPESVSSTQDIHWYVNSYSIGSSSDNPLSIAPVILNADGLVIGQAAGTATVYCEVNGVRSNIVNITVSNKEVEASLTLDSTPISMIKGQTRTLTAVVTPDTMENKVVWTTSDSEIVSVSGAGATAVITAGSKPGTATVTATLNKIKKTVQVTVAVPVRLDKHEMILTSREGVTGTLTPTVAGDGYSVETLVWTSSDDSKATVAAGVVDPADDLTETAVVTIRAATPGENPYYDECIVTINPQGAMSAPVADPDSGAVYANTAVSLECAVSGTNIYYTTDGNDPVLTEDGEPADENTKLYTDAIRVTEAVTIKAMAYKKGYRPSAVAEFEYTLITDDWGDIEADALKTYFENDSSNVPSGVWYAFRDPDTEYGTDPVIYTESGDTHLHFVYTGSKITFNDRIEVYHGTRRLTENRDYTISYANNLNAGDRDSVNKKRKSIAPKFTVTGKLNYKGKSTFGITIDPADLGDAVLATPSEMTLTAGKKVKLSSAAPTLTYNGKKLIAGTDYTLKYYAGGAAEDEALIADPSKEIVNAGGKDYLIVATSITTKSTNFTGELAETVLVTSVSSTDKNIAQVDKYKIGNNKGKAVKIAYASLGTEDMAAYLTDGGAVDVVKLFDNSPDREDGKPALAYVYTGKVQKALVYGRDFTVSAVTSSDHKSAGTHGFVITGTKRDLTDEEKAAGEQSVIGIKYGSYEITGTALSKLKIAGLNTTAQYTGSEITLDDLFNPKEKTAKAYNSKAAEADKIKTVTICKSAKSGKTTVYTPLNGAEVGSPEADTADYVYSMSNKGLTGKITLTFTGQGGYSGTVKKTITVKPYDVKKDARKCIVADFAETNAEGLGTAEYSKAGAKPQMTVSYVTEWNEDGTVKTAIPLREGVDYTVSYKNNSTIAADGAALRKLKSAKRPVAVIKGRGNFTGTNTSNTFCITKTAINTNVKVTVDDVAYNKKGKNGYFLKVPKLTDGGKVLKAGKNKDVEALTKKQCKYYYAEDCELADGTPKYAGEVVDPKHKVTAGTAIRVEVTVKCAAKSPYLQTAETVLTGYYRVIVPGHNISKAKVSVKDTSKISFDDARGIVIDRSNLKVTLKGIPGELGAADYDIVSVTGNSYVGTATITIAGKGDFGGTRTFTVKIPARGFT